MMREKDLREIQSFLSNNDWGACNQTMTRSLIINAACKTIQVRVRFNYSNCKPPFFILYSDKEGCIGDVYFCDQSNMLTAYRIDRLAREYADQIRIANGEIPVFVKDMEARFLYGQFERFIRANSKAL